jgi:Ca-activated chloride channel family protein
MEFLNIEAFFIMLIPLILLALRISKNFSNIDKIFSKEVLDKLLILNNSLSNSARNTLYLLALFFMIIAFARPVILKEDIKVKSKGNSIVIAFDISKSMLVKDIYPNRLKAVKQKIENILKSNSTDKIAIIAFTSSAYMVAPLSVDKSSLIYLLQNINNQSITTNGTSIIAALESANRILKDEQNKNIIIFSDGGDQKEFSQEIEFANKNNLKVYISNIATSKGGPIEIKNSVIKDKNGNIVISKRNDNIKKLALNTNGLFTTYDISNNDIKSILNDIKKSNEKTKFNEYNIKDYYELFIYPLAISIIILIFAFSSIPIKRRKINEKSL